MIPDDALLFGSTAQFLRGNHFPLKHLARYPISCLESMATEINSIYRGVCPIGCLGCCANAVHPSEARGKVYTLTPHLLNGILKLFEEFIRDDIHLLSLGRLTLSSGSNELNNPYCIELRERLSSFLERHYGVLLGALSSDVSFHISNSSVFSENLQHVIEKPLLWDNICLSIDEQIPFQSAKQYKAYLEQLSWTWNTLGPALKSELDHPKKHRRKGPRVIINMLIPDVFDRYDTSNDHVYPRGLCRASSYEELIRRYIKPFVGDIIETSDKIPDGHVFTTALGQLSRIPKSLVYVSASKFIRLGRANTFIQSDRTGNFEPNCYFIRTKLYPAGISQFVIRGCMATTAVSEDELSLQPSELPSWFEALRRFVIDVGCI